MGRWQPLQITMDGQDLHRRLTELAVIGLFAGAAMALFGLPPIDVHGPLHYAGIMDPLCGGTRSVHSLMSADLSTAWRYNPVAFPLVLGAISLLIRHVVGFTAGRWINVRIANRRVFGGVAATLLVALDVNQQLHADLLRSSPDRLSFLGPVILAGIATVVYLLLRRPRVGKVASQVTSD
ncbi:DUF2752 domain-containing protein [Actinomadura geliboluensis]|uniref:DUF2752 domain-containing protein n=2 Tax=Actinomadura geliboluensis TaxID=882440 RepID=A0A5S4HBC6_9ACTN|nr:DUF2752 domain-containing protein [Actinomadura geliboluensis]